MILEHEPVHARPYRPPKGKKRRKRSSPPRFRGVGLAVLLLALVTAGTWYAMEQVQLIRFETSPATATVQVESPHLIVEGHILLWRGQHVANVEAEGHYSRQIEFEAGEGASRIVQVTLDPLPGRLRVSTTPETEGEVRIDGERTGKIGEILEDLSPGRHVVQVSVEGFEMHRQTVEIEGYDQLTEIEISLKAVTEPALLEISSTPEAADILIDGTWQGRTPKRITLTPDTRVEVALLFPGHAPDRQTLKLESGRQSHTVTLTPRLGVLELWPSPANATIRIDGQVELRRQLQLAQRTHVVEVSAPSYITKKYIVVPHPEAPQQLFAVLPLQSTVARSRRQKHEQGLGLVFVEFRPRESFEIATTRRRIPVRLTRPFAIMDKEVTNALYQRYQARHDSGEVLGNRLDRPNQPVVRLSWTDTALFANWMSEQAGVSPFYRVRDGQVVGFDAQATGYRLPSEAEWVWLARSGKRYAWGDFMPPPDRFGNLADASAADVVQPVLEGYNDGHTVSANVGSFPPSAQGLYDLPGNVAEWMHDVFLDKLRVSVRPETERINPLGEASGRHHVIRGFGWRDAGRRELSLNNRRYDRDPKDDVGFRLAYYLDKP